MAIKNELYMIREDNVQLIRTYSDLNLKIEQEQTGIIYDDAIDVIPCRYIYKETNIPIDNLDSMEE